MSSNIKIVEVGIKDFPKDLQLPFYRHRGDMGMDVCAAADYIILPGQTILIATGLSVVLPENYALEVRPRSGLSLKTNLHIANSPGTIDSGYRDEIKIIMRNLSQAALIAYNDPTEIPLKTLESSYGKIPLYDLNVKSTPHGAYKICRGDRIAQLILVPIYQAQWTENVGEAEFDRQGGFGHSGVK